MMNYDKHTLINVGKGSAGIGLNAADLQILCPHYPLACKSSQTKHHSNQCDRPTKRGKRAGTSGQLTRLGPRPVPLPSLLLPDVWSQENGTDEVGLRLCQQQETRDCGAHIYAGTWLHHNIPVWPLTSTQWSDHLPCWRNMLRCQPYYLPYILWVA